MLKSEVVPGLRDPHDCSPSQLIEVQDGISRRDRGVLKITTTSGQPPSALGMLERYAELDAPEEMQRTLYEGRDWCASVLQSHASYPSLIYFRSVGTGAGWPGALGSLMDPRADLRTSA
ncbi:hypothetical protein [Bradyrhizobium sp. USDA 4452]